MKVSRFQIELIQNPCRIFFPGDTVHGVVLLQLEKPVKVKGIKIAAHGYALAKLSTLVAQEDYFHDRHSVIDPATGRKLKNLQAGTHKYTFTYVLPKEIPASAFSQDGLVSYKVKSELVGTSVKTELDFSVRGTLDLNFLPEAQQCVHVRKQKKLHYFTCSHPRGPIGFKLTLQKAGFVPGEYLEFFADLTNQSSRSVLACKATLFQKWQYFAEDQTNKSVRKICEVDGPAVAPGETGVWRGNIFKIPELPPSGLKFCDIMDVCYFLKFEMKVAGKAVNLRTSIPIIVGTKGVETDFESLLRLHGFGVTLN